MKKARFILLLFVVWLSLNANTPREIIFDQTDSFLKKYVKNGLVDYKTLKDDPSELNTLVRLIETIDISRLAEENERKAFWINTYNILVIKAVVANYPIKSPLDVEGFFDITEYTAAQMPLTLDEIEKQYLWETYRDPRIHFVLVCAAGGCPPIINEAYRPGMLETQLNERTQTVLNSDDFIQLNRAEKEVLLSEIFNWYKGDFEKGGKTILEYINQFREKKIPANYAIGYYPYDWSLNGL